MDYGFNGIDATRRRHRHGIGKAVVLAAGQAELEVGPERVGAFDYTVRPLDLLRIWHSRYEAWILEQGRSVREKGAREGIEGSEIMQSDNDCVGYRIVIAFAS